MLLLVVLLLYPLDQCSAAENLDSLALSYARKPGVANRAALLAFATSQPGTPGGLAFLAVGVRDVQNGRAAEGLAYLRTARDRLPTLADFASYWLASASLASGDSPEAARAAEAVTAFIPKSPMTGRAALLAAKAYLEDNVAGSAVRVLRRAHNDLPQPEGDFALAGAYEAAGDAKSAAALYQRIWLAHPARPEASEAETALQRLPQQLGAPYPPPAAGDLLERATKLMEAGRHSDARAEFSQLAVVAGGLVQDLASVRVGAADHHARKDSAAKDYLETLEVSSAAADAERFYYLVQTGRRLNRPDIIDYALGQLWRKHTKSDWRLKALVSAGNEYLLRDEFEKYDRIYRACYDQFPDAAQAPYCHWKVAFGAYLREDTRSSELLNQHLSRYPNSGKAAAAMYFLGRMAERAENWSSARVYYTRIDSLFPNYYYGVLARERLSKMSGSGEVISPPAGLPAASRPRTLSFAPPPDARPRFERARMLASAALDDLAEIELRFGASEGAASRSAAFGLELARLADRRDKPERAIRFLNRYVRDYPSAHLASAPREFWHLAFPLPWRRAIETHSRAAGLDPFMVAALIRQESEFDSRAISRANAYGLTQVLPSTGRELSRKLGIRPFRTARLFEPDLNLRLGTTYLKSLRSGLDGRWDWTLAAYNAGKTRVVAWRARASYRDSAEFVESIPFTETRTYVQIVIRNADIYRRLYQAKRTEPADPAK